MFIITCSLRSLRRSSSCSRCSLVGCGLFWSSCSNSPIEFPSKEKLVMRRPLPRRAPAFRYNLDVRRHLAVARGCWAASYTETQVLQHNFVAPLQTAEHPGPPPSPAVGLGGVVSCPLHRNHGGTMAEAAEEHEELVKVFDTEEESEAMVVRGLLESAGIDAIIQNREAPQDILPGVGGVVVLVRPGQAEEAVETIEAYRKSPTTDA